MRKFKMTERRGLCVVIFLLHFLPHLHAQEYKLKFGASYTHLRNSRIEADGHFGWLAGLQFQNMLDPDEKWMLNIEAELVTRHVAGHAYRKNGSGFDPVQVTFRYAELRGYAELCYYPFKGYPGISFGSATGLTIPTSDEYFHDRPTYLERDFSKVQTLGHEEMITANDLGRQLFTIQWIRPAVGICFGKGKIKASARYELGVTNFYRQSTSLKVHDGGFQLALYVYLAKSRLLKKSP